MGKTALYWDILFPKNIPAVFFVLPPSFVGTYYKNMSLNPWKYYFLLWSTEKLLDLMKCPMIILWATYYCWFIFLELYFHLNKTTQNFNYVRVNLEQMTQTLSSSSDVPLTKKKRKISNSSDIIFNSFQSFHLIF